MLKRYPGLFSPQEIHSIENLREVPRGNVNNKIHLSEIRVLWNSFYRANPSPTRQGILDFATMIDRKLGVFFKPPVL
ncbi:hypothetical protein [Salsipaludibacter albus]|uniref:hypothetical protein n=1 Tax=Salsipaludibacter albus TaxID=2849650 RepID=UPI001EE45045|nr:hypothetical protein [Salsipaludibacter albus]MBY5162880.1 hypothetical protein [Salsipaludibacter albus]